MSPLRDLEVILAAAPGSLARFGDTLGAAGVSLEGGGVFTHEGVAFAHFLVADSDTATAALDRAGIGPVTVREVVMVRLDQDVPGQLGAFTGRLGDAGIRILHQYSDHDHRLVVVTDPAQHDAAVAIAERWTAERRPGSDATGAGAGQERPRQDSNLRPSDEKAVCSLG